MVNCTENIPVSAIRTWVSDAPPTFSPISLDTRRAMTVMPTIGRSTGKWRKNVQIYRDISPGEGKYVGGMLDIWREGDEAKHLHASIIPTPEADVMEAILHNIEAVVRKSPQSADMMEEDIRKTCISMAQEQIGTLLTFAGPVTISGGKVKIGEYAELKPKELIVFDQPIEKSHEKKWLGEGPFRYKVSSDKTGITLEFLCGVVGTQIILYCVSVNEKNYDVLMAKLMKAANENKLNSDSIHEFVNPHFKMEDADYIPDLDLDALP